MTSKLALWISDDTEQRQYRPWSQSENNKAKRLRTHVDLDEPRAWQQAAEPSRLRAAYGIPGFEPDGLSQFGSIGYGTGVGGFEAAQAAQEAAVFRSIATSRIDISGVPGLHPSAPINPPGKRVMGGSRAHERVTVQIIARQFFIPNEEVFSNANFRVGELIYAYCNARQLRELQVGYEEARNVLTVATQAQLRAFESGHVLYANDFYQDIGVKPKEDGKGYEQVDANGDPYDPARVPASRESCLTRWRPAGVCINVAADSPGFVLITLCVQGPTMMFNYFHSDIPKQTPVYIREMSVIPVNFAPRSGMSTAEREEQARQRVAMTVESIDVWPNAEAVQQYMGYLDGADTGSGGSTWDMRYIGRHSWMEPPRNMTTNADKSKLEAGGTFYGNDADGLVYLGVVMMLYDSDPTSQPDVVDGTGFLRGSKYGTFGPTTRVYGQLRINLSPYMGMTPKEIFELYNHRAFRPAEDD